MEEGSCLKCSQKCKECLDGEKCRVCKAGFWLSERKKCEKCRVLSCKECEESGRCRRCKEGFELVGNVCREKKGRRKDHLSFEEFKKKYKKEYSVEEEAKKRAIYEHNVDQLDMYEGEGFSVGVNQLFDLTARQVERMTGYHESSGSRKGQASEVEWKVGNNAPLALNWTERGVVSDVRDQGICGSCWAFGCVANAESVLILNGWETLGVDLSEQYFVECTKDSDCEGTYYVEYVMDEALKGIPRESAFPYDPFNAHAGICAADERVHISDQNLFYYSKTDSEIIELLQSGPLVATISASGWNAYSGGIFECSSTAPLNHVVQLVGYDESSWLIKNQWGDYWGENGYMRITRDPNYNCKMGAEFFDFKRVLCNVPGCSQCAIDDNNLCIACKDTSAAVVNGGCVCQEPNEVLTAQGLCVACRVLGCEACEATNPDQCRNCSSETRLGNDGRCACANETLVLNPNGVCEVCEVKGCSSCQPGDPSTCVNCRDCSAFISGGACHCNVGSTLEL